MHKELPGPAPHEYLSEPDDDFYQPEWARGRVKSLQLWAPPPLHRVADVSPAAKRPKSQRRAPGLPRRFTMGQKE